jgi:2-polyprenyl-6-methoxyphenol hydroxylase-like FAD-dependent oxidoreductase
MSMIMRRPSIAIVGAGPAGLTAARILQQHAWDVSVFDADASATARDQGGTLDLHPDTGQLALQRAGLLPAFMARARHDDQGNRLLDHRDAAILFDHVPAPDEPQRPEIDRGVLRTLFLDALAPDTVQWNHRLLDVTRAPDGRLETHFAGRASRSFDLVIGADGAWSRVRRALTPAMPAYSGVTFVELQLDDVDHAHPAIAALVGHGTMFVLHDGKGLIAQRNGNARIRVYAGLRIDARDDFAADVQTRRGKAHLLRHFAGWAAPLLALLEDADAVTAVRPIVALAPGLRWPAQRGLTLVGDAAHVMPPVGVGANLAMLDAADLALVLVDAGAGWEQAVADYEDAMLTRAAAFASEAQVGFAEMFGPDGAGTFLAHMQVSAAPARP